MDQDKIARKHLLLLFKGSAATMIIVIICAIAVIGMIAYLYLGNASSGTTASSDSSSQPTITVPVKDFAPNVPMSKKTTILIQTSDSSDIKYIVPTDEVDTYVKNLPEGYQVVSKTP
jgi:flagellar basal body-associated protein FliL